MMTRSCALSFDVRDGALGGFGLTMVHFSPPMSASL
jgi:hypothetical protein